MTGSNAHVTAEAAESASCSASVLATLPDAMRLDDQACQWSQEVLGVGHVGSFLEGPSPDNAGGLFCTDLAHGRVFHLGAAGHFAVVADYDGHPNGTALHRDGRLFVADYALGLITIDPATGDLQRVVSGYRLEPFRGLSDLVFATDGTLYFSDQGQSDLRFPDGRVFCWTASAGLRLLMDGIPSPNGMALSPDGRILYVAVTRANCVYRVPVRGDGSVGKVGVYLHLSGGHGGPDGLAATADGGLAVAHYGLGVVHMFDHLGRPSMVVRSPVGTGTTNAAFGGADRRTLLITEADSGSVLSARVPAPGHPLYGSYVT